MRASLFSGAGFSTTDPPLSGPQRRCILMRFRGITGAPLWKNARVPTDRQRRRRAKLARQAAHEPRSAPAPAHVVDAVREAFGQALEEQAPREPAAVARAQGRRTARRPGQKELYSVSEAAARLGVNRSTLYRRAAAGALALTHQPYTRQRMVSRDELERHAHRHRSARGRPPVLSDALLARILAMREQGMSLPAIGAQLEHEGVPTAHGGKRWWPSAVQAALRRASA
jgi:excisionase family DNA binding protein